MFDGSTANVKASKEWFPPGFSASRPIHLGGGAAVVGSCAGPYELRKQQAGLRLQKDSEATMTPVKATCGVTIPCHNGEAWLAAAFESVMRQTYSDFHLVLVDDASQDATLELAHRLAGNRSDVTVISLAKNSGRCAARNKGARAVDSPFIAFLDQDDSYAPDFLRVSLETLAKYPQIDAARVLPKVSIDVHPLQLESIATSLANTMVFRRTAFEFIGGWPESDVFRRYACGGEDVALRNLFLMIFREGAVDLPLYNYSHRPGNALDLFLQRSMVIGEKLVFRSDDDERQIIRDEIGCLKQGLADKLRQFVYDHHTRRRPLEP